MDLFETTAELKDFVALDDNANIRTLLPFIGNAQRQFIAPAIGQALFDDLVADLDANRTDTSGMTPANQALLPYVQRPAANYVMYGALPQIGVRIGDLGIQDQHGESSAPAPKWKVDQLRLEFLSNADTFMEDLLGFLELNQVDFPDYVAYSGNSLNAGAIVPDVATASQYVDINESRRVFMRMKKTIRMIESRLIPKLISPELYAEITDQIKNEAITQANQDLIDLLRPLISKMSLYLLIPSMKVSITDQGIHLISVNDSVTSKTAAPRDAVKDLAESLKCGLFGYEADQEALIQYLEDNVDTYSLYKNSLAHSGQPDPGPKTMPINKPDNKFFSV